MNRFLESCMFSWLNPHFINLVVMLKCYLCWIRRLSTSLSWKCLTNRKRQHILLLLKKYCRSVEIFHEKQRNNGFINKTEDEPASFVWGWAISWDLTSAWMLTRGFRRWNVPSYMSGLHLWNFVSRKTVSICKRDVRHQAYFPQES